MSDSYFKPIEESRWSEQTTEVSTGERIFFCRYEDRNGDWVPVAGVSRYTDGLGFGESWEDDLICIRVKRVGSGPAQPDQDIENSEFSYCRITAEYATATPLDSVWSVNTTGKLELVETGIGKRFASDGAISNQSRVIPIGIEEIEARRVFAYSQHQMQALEALKGCVNANLMVAPWVGVYERGTLLYLNYDAQDYWDKVRDKHLNYITIHFIKKKIDHNYFWRVSDINSEAGFWETNVPPDFPYVDLTEILHE